MWSIKHYWLHPSVKVTAFKTSMSAYEMFSIDCTGLLQMELECSVSTIGEQECAPVSHGLQE